MKYQGPKTVKNNIIKSVTHQISDPMPFEISENITWKNLDSGIVLLNLKTSDYYTLNETASFICRMIIDGKDEADITAEMTREYNCDKHTCMDDIKEQIDFLLNEGLIKKI